MNKIQNLNTNKSQLVYKKQNYFIGKVCLLSSLLFGIIFAISFVISKFVFIDYVEYNYLILMGSISLLISIVFSLIMSFKGLKASIGLIITTIMIYCLSFIITFSAIFSLIDNVILFYSLAFTAISILVLGLIGFLIKPKYTFSLMKISMIIFGIYFLVSIIGSLIIWFTISDSSIEIWEIIITAIIGLIVMATTILSFYNLKNTNQFINIVNIEKSVYTKLLLFQTLNLLSSIVMIFTYILRILGIINRD